MAAEIGASQWVWYGSTVGSAHAHGTKTMAPTTSSPAGGRLGTWNTALPALLPPLPLPWPPPDPAAAIALGVAAATASGTSVPSTGAMDRAGCGFSNAAGKGGWGGAVGRSVCVHMPSCPTSSAARCRERGSTQRGGAPPAVRAHVQQQNEILIAHTHGASVWGSK